MASEFGKIQSIKSPMQQRKQHSQISGLLVASMSSSPITDDQDDITGKKRKHFQTTIKTEWESPSLFQHTYKNSTCDGKISLQIIKQPERQHRARYQTEGSRGAIKDRSQNMFPSVQLKGYAGINGMMGSYPPTKPPILQVFIGNDQGDPIPHIYYQACKVAGKNSTPCHELKKEGTDVILIDMDPARFYEVNCDCVGILKERASDIENKKPHQTRRTNWRKKTTKCRMVFRTEVENRNGEMEVLQVVSDPISCTQLPGTPEITKMSLSTCTTSGGEELWMIGKNFLKDCVVVFQESACSRRLPDRVWVKSVEPLKDYFHSTHLIVNVPPYSDANIKEAVRVNVTVKCGGKESDNFVLTYLPTNSNFSKCLGQTIGSIKGNLFSSKQRQQSSGGNGSIESPKFISNGTQDDCSPAQSLNKISASARSTRSSTNSFTTITPTSNTILPVNNSPASCNNGSSNLTMKSSKSYNKSRITILEQLDCSSTGSSRKTRGSKRSKDSKYRSSLPRKIEQPDIFSDDTLFDTVDTTNISKTTPLITSKPFQSLANNHQIVTPQVNGNEKRLSLTSVTPGSPDKKNKNNSLTDTSALYTLLQTSFSTTPNKANEYQRQNELLQNLSAPSPASVTNYRDFSEDSTSIVSHDDTTLDEESNDSSRMSSSSVSTIKDDTLVSSITIATPFTNGTQEAANLSKPNIPLSFLGITKRHKRFTESQQHSAMNGSHVSSTTQETKPYNKEETNHNEDGCLIEAMESHSALISTPTNEVTGTVYNFASSQFGSGGICDQAVIKMNSSSTTSIGTGNLICHPQQQQRILSSDILQQQQPQQILQHSRKQFQLQEQQQKMYTNVNQETAVDNPGPASSLSTLSTKVEMENLKSSQIVENTVINPHQAPQMQDQIQLQPIAQEKCKYSIANAESEVASISIKLPPSILANQDRLESIVNTINKAITSPPENDQKNSQQAAEMIASININNTQQQQQSFTQSSLTPQNQQTQAQAFTQGPVSIPQENNANVLAENVPGGNNVSNFGHQQLQMDHNVTPTQDWNFDQDGAEAKKIKVSATEKEICDAAAVNATNALNSVTSVSTCNSIPVAQTIPQQCFTEVDVQGASASSNTWTSNAQAGQTYANPVLNSTHATNFSSSSIWNDEVKDPKKIQYIEGVSGQPTPTIPNSNLNWSNAIDVPQGNKDIPDTPTDSAKKAMDAVAAAANVTNAINAAAASLNAVAASSILDAQAATNALNAAAAAASAMNNLNAVTAMADAAVTGHVDPPMRSWAQSGSTSVISNSIQTSQHNYSAVETQSTFPQASTRWSNPTKPNSPESREQGTLWNGATLQHQQGSFDSGSAAGEFASITNSSGPNWTSKVCESNQHSPEQVKQTSTIPASDVWQANENLSPGFVSAANTSNNYAAQPSSSWTNETQDQKIIDQRQATDGSHNPATNTNSPTTLATWQSVNSPESFTKVQNTQGTFSPVSSWNDNIKEAHNSPVGNAVHTNTSYSDVDNQQQFNHSTQIWSNQQGEAKAEKTSSNVNADSQMWDLSQQNSSLQGQNIPKSNSLQINAVSEIHQGQQLQQNVPEGVGNSSSTTPSWETTTQSASIKSVKQDIMVGEEWSSPINNDPMLSETSAGVIQQHQKAEEKWPAFNTKPKCDNQWNTTTENNLTPQQTQKTDWAATFNQQPHSENQSSGTTNWPQFSTSSKTESSSIQQPVEQQPQQKQTVEAWPAFTDQSGNKWQTPPQELPGSINKLPLGTVEASKTSDWPSFDETGKNTEKSTATNDAIQQNQAEGDWNTQFKLQTGKDTTEWKVISNQPDANIGVTQCQQDPVPQHNVWSPSSQQQQQVSQDKWLENKDPEKWLQGAPVGQQGVTAVSETWAATLNVENKTQQSNVVVTTNSWPVELQAANVENKTQQNNVAIGYISIGNSDNLSATEDKQPQQTWSISTQQQVQTLPISVPGISGGGDVRSVLNNEAHQTNISSSGMLVGDPKDTALSVELSASLKEITPMEVDTGSYDNPLLTPNPSMQ